MSELLRTRLDVLEHEVIDDISTTIFAGHPGLEDLKPDDHKAYVRLRICHSLPNLIGPEMNGGLIFGFHPRALARNYTSLLHQQTNIGHRLKAHGHAANDAINGCIIAVSFSGDPEDDFEELPSASAAPYLDVLAVMFKAAHGVSNLLGQHLGNRKPWSVSIETRLLYKESGVFDSRNGSIVPFSELDSDLFRMVKGVPSLKKVDGGKLAWVLGGANGEADFDLSGIGYVHVPAEKTAHIVSLAASEQDAEGISIAAGSEPDFFPGVPVSWPVLASGAFGGGVVKSVRYEGDCFLHGMCLKASVETPVLEIVLPDDRVILRRSCDVEKK